MEIIFSRCILYGIKSDLNMFGKPETRMFVVAEAGYESLMRYLVVEAEENEESCTC